LVSGEDVIMAEMNGGDIDDGYLRRWVDTWAAAYEPEWDLKIDGLAGKDAFSHADVEPCVRVEVPVHVA
jgi:hypothetical protein